MNAHRARELALRLVTFLASLHSLLLGFTMLVFPSWFLTIMRWPYPERPFYPSQSGIFLIILCVAYFSALKYRGMVRFIIFSKMAAVAFLLALLFFVSAPSVILLTAILDGLMGSALWVLYHLTEGPPES